MSSKRSYCLQCQYPQSVCLCHQVSPMTTKHQIVILQHPSEISQAKASARLVKLCISNTLIVNGEASEDFAGIIKRLSEQQTPCYLIYPSESSQMIEKLDEEQGENESSTNAKTLIFLDGNWKKTFKMLQLNPWLKNLPCLSFAQQQQSQYKIRKSNKPHSLSTLEAVAYCLQHLDNTDTSPLVSVFNAMIDNQWRFMSKKVQSNYSE